MTPPDQADHLAGVDSLLSEIRDQLSLIDAESDVFELRALHLLLEITKVIHSQPDVHTLITLILDSVLSFMDGDRAFLMLYDLKNEGPLRFKLGRNQVRDYLTAEDFVISTSVVAETLKGDAPLILVDTQNEAAFNKRQSVQDLALRTIMAAPLRGNGKTIGLIYVDSQRPIGKVTPHHVTLLASLADQAAVAIHNALKFETHHG